MDVSVRSAGLLHTGQPASSHGVAVLSERGIDLSTHRSRSLTAEFLRDADLVLAMAREHVREAVVLVPEVWPRTFTLKELVRRGEEIGPRRPGEPLEEWLARAHAGRSRQQLIGYSADDDVADPIGRPRGAYERMVADLDDLVERLVWLVWGEADARPRAVLASDGSDS